MRHQPHIESQLTAAANAADRGNRPTLFVVVPAALLVGALILTLVSIQRFASAKRSLAVGIAEVEEVKGAIADSVRVRAEQPDIDTLYPVNVYMDADINEQAQAVWDETDPPVKIGVKKAPRKLLPSDQVVRSDVDCTVIKPVDLVDLFDWIERVVTNEKLRGVFLAKLDLRPSLGGWTGNITFRLYEKARNQ